jgi:hypothetical protein
VWKLRNHRYRLIADAFAFGDQESKSEVCGFVNWGASSFCGSGLCHSFVLDPFIALAPNDQENSEAKRE